MTLVPPDSRYAYVPAENRLAAVAGESRTAVAVPEGPMATKLSWDPKDPNEVLDYTLDWSARLVTNDTIASSTWTVTSGDVVINSNTFTTTSTKVWLSAGTDGTDCTVQNRVTTVGGRTMDQTVKLRVRAR